MQQRALHIDKAQHIALFDALSQLMRQVVNLAADSDLTVLLELDMRLAQGCISNLQFSIGNAGALSFSLSVTNNEGESYEVMTIDAPSTEKNFFFCIPSSQSSDGA